MESKRTSQRWQPFEEIYWRLFGVKAVNRAFVMVFFYFRLDEIGSFTARRPNPFPLVQYSGDSFQQWALTKYRTSPRGNGSFHTDSIIDR